MYLTYTAPDGAVERYDIDDLAALEAEAIEAVLDLDWEMVEQDLMSQKPGAMRAVLWAFRKRDDPELRFAGFDVAGWRKALRVKLTRADIDDLIDDNDTRLGGEDSPERLKWRYQLRKVADNVADVDAALGTGPKGEAVSGPSESGTSGTSRTSSTSRRKTSTPSPSDG